MEFARTLLGKPCESEEIKTHIEGNTFQYAPRTGTTVPLQKGIITPDVRRKWDKYQFESSLVPQEYINEATKLINKANLSLPEKDFKEFNILLAKVIMAGQFYWKDNPVGTKGKCVEWQETYGNFMNTQIKQSLLKYKKYIRVSALNWKKDGTNMDIGHNFIEITLGNDLSNLGDKNDPNIPHKNFYLDDGFLQGRDDFIEQMNLLIPLNYLHSVADMVAQRLSANKFNISENPPSNHTELVRYNYKALYIPK